jgi:hypothetical protein
MPQRVLNFPQMHEGSLTPSDHDILVRVELLAGLAQKDISEIKNSQASYAAATDVRIRALEVALQGKAESIEVEQLQRWKSGMMVVHAMAGSAAGILGSVVARYLFPPR